MQRTLTGMSLGLAQLILCWPALAQSTDPAASDWVDADVARSRLIAQHVGVASSGGSFVIAWEVELEDGWKTYWRSPGEAGKPPTFTWDGSVNVAGATLRFPLPERFVLFDIQTFGYDKHFVLPIVITPQIDGGPVSFRASVDYLVCKDICIPLESSFELDLPVVDGEPARSAYALDIGDSLSRVPVAAGAGLSDLEIKNVSLFGPPGNQRLTVEVSADRLLSGADVLVEAGPGVIFDAPRRALIGDGEGALFTMDVGSYARDVDLSGADITITFSDGWGGAIETIVGVDRSKLAAR